MRIPLRLLVLLGFLLLGRLAWATTPPTAGRPLAEVLNADGTLKPGAAGSFDPKGYELVDVAGSRQPTFRPVGQRRVQSGGGGSWQLGFEQPLLTQTGSGNQINVVLRASNGDVYVGGDFERLNGVRVNSLACWRAGSWSSVGSGVNGVVECLALAPDGTLYAGGSFVSSSGSPITSLLVWSPTGGWTSLGSTINNRVVSVALAANGDVYIAGAFTQIGSQAFNRVARWDGTAWQTMGSGFSTTPAAMVSDGGNGIYITGSFTTVSGVPANRIARWNGTTWSALGTGLNLSGQALVADGTRGVYVGGTFTTAGSQPVNRIAHWTGSIWQAVGMGLGSTVRELALTSTGTLYAACTDNTVYYYAGTSWVATEAANSRATYALADNGSGGVYAGGAYSDLVGTYTYPALRMWNTTDWQFVGQGMDNTVWAIILDGRGGAYVGGSFQLAGGILTNRVARWDGRGWIALGSGMNDIVYALALDATGNLYAGGNFTQAGTVAANRIAKWNGTAWSAVGMGFNNPVYALLVDGNTVYAGGGFSTADGAACVGLARWTGVAWGPVGSTGANNAVFSLVKMGSSVYAGGAFTTIDGSSAARVARWDGSNWSPLGTGLANGTVYAMTPDGSGGLYVGGNFTSAGTVTVNRIARWNGSTWTALGLGFLDSVVALAVGGDGNLYAGGLFGSINQATYANALAQWDGTTWYESGSPNSYVRALQPAGGRAMYVGGQFNDQTMARFAIYNAAAPMNTAPTITAQTFSLPENSPNGTAVGTVQATGLTYSITTGNTGGAFAINSSTGALTVANAAALDYETTPSFALTVQVTDGTTPATATVTVNLSDVDEVRPTVSISSPAGANGSSTGTTPIPFTVTFSESVSGFVPGDVTVTGGSIVPGSLTVLSASTYTIQVIPTGSGSTVTVNVPANVAQDAAGNGNTAAPQFSITYSQPVTATPAILTPANNSITNQAVTFSGTAPAGSLVLLYVSVNGTGYQQLDDVIATAGGTFSSQAYPLPPTSYRVYATAQSPGAAVSAQTAITNFVVDQTGPTVALTSTTGASGTSTSTSPFAFTATFSESVTGFVAGDLTVTNGTVSNFAGSGTTYTFDVTPTTAGTATTVTVAGNSSVDAAGNGNAASATYSLTYNVTSVTWNGSTSTDWFTAGNWTPAVVPTASLDATIPTVPSGSRFPVIAANAATAAARNVSIAPGAALRMSANLLAIAGNLTNNGSFNGFVGSGSTATGGIVVLGGTVLSSLLGSGSTSFWDLAVGSSQAQLNTSAGASVRRLLTLAGNFITNGNSFTLVSDADGTGMVYNQGGIISGNVTVQRYISPATNAGMGYRHYSSPVGQATVGSLATAGFSPVVNPAYNTSATPTLVTPFPTVYGYDQSRLASTTNNLDAFSKGWQSPASTTDALTVGKGYSVNIAAGQTFSVTGGQNTGTMSQTLARGPVVGNPDQSGWHLVGNPYPSPLNYSLVAAADRVNLDAAIYIYASTTQYAGNYRSYVNGVGGDPILPQGQGFFARVSAGQTSGQLTFRNAQRVTSYSNPTFLRGTGTRPLVQLDLQGTTGADPLYVYFEQGATAGTDAEFDALKLPNPTGLNLAAVAGNDEMSINGLPTLGAANVTVPLQVRVPATGSYTLHAAQLLNLSTTHAYLRDRQTGAVQDLSLTPDYTFSLNAAYMGVRFELFFTPQRVLSVAPASLSAQVAVFPNPAHKAVFVELPATLTQSAVTVTLVDALGRTVLTQKLATGSTSQQLSLEGVTTGVYAVRLQTAQGTVTKKLTVE